MSLQNHLQEGIGNEKIGALLCSLMVLASLTTCQKAEQAGRESGQTVAETDSAPELPVYEQNIITGTVTEIDGYSIKLETIGFGGGSFPGGYMTQETVSAINISGSSRKYSVEMELPRGEKMVGGMNASVTVTVGTAENVVSVPAEAVVNIGGKAYVYTDCDRDDVLTDPVEVTSGISDGINVEVDLPEGSTYWYEYYDTPPVQFPF